MRNLNEWFKWHNSQPGVERCPEELLTPDCSGDTLNKWLQVYVRCTLPKLETKQVSHTHRRHYSLLTGILRSMTAQNPRYPNFIEKKSVVFVDFHRCLGNSFRKLREDGIGAESRHAPSISIDIQCVPGTSKPGGVRLRSRSETKTALLHNRYTQHVHIIVLTLLFFCAGNCIKLQRNI